MAFIDGGPVVCINSPAPAADLQACTTGQSPGEDQQGYERCSSEPQWLVGF